MRLSLLLMLPMVAPTQPASVEQLRVHEGEIFKGKPARLRLNTAFAREFRSQIEDAAKRGANFAGKFTIAEWGCGSGCVQMAIVDEENGAVSKGPFRVLSFAAPLNFADDSTSTSSTFEPLVFHLDSRELIVRGCPDEDEKACALYHYIWWKSKFYLTQTLPASR